VFPQSSLTLPRPFPLYAALPRSEYRMSESDFHHRFGLPQKVSYRSAYSARKRFETVMDLPGSRRFRFGRAMLLDPAAVSGSHRL
jgi:hypothetical protein